MKKKIARFLCSILVCVMAILCAACTGNDSTYPDKVKQEQEICKIPICKTEKQKRHNFKNHTV